VIGCVDKKWVSDGGVEVMDGVEARVHGLVLNDVVLAEVVCHRLRCRHRHVTRAGVVCPYVVLGDFIRSHLPHRLVVPSLRVAVPCDVTIDLVVVARVVEVDSCASVVLESAVECTEAVVCPVVIDFGIMTLAIKAVNYSQVRPLVVRVIGIVVFDVEAVTDLNQDLSSNENRVLDHCAAIGPDVDPRDVGQQHPDAGLKRYVAHLRDHVILNQIGHPATQDRRPRRIGDRRIENLV